MFPRGAGNLEEVPSTLVELCTISATTQQQAVAAQPPGLGTLFGTVATEGIG